MVAGIGVALTLAASPPPAAAATVSSPASRLLSNETTYTRWSYPTQIAPIYQEPSTASPCITRLRWNTPDGFSQTYLLLREFVNGQGQEWVKLRIPMRPNGRTGWVQRDALGAYNLTHLLLVVNRERLTISLYDRGRLRWSAPVAVGKPSTPTPPGHFWITERINVNEPSSGYYPYVLATSDYSTLTNWPSGGIVALHGPYYQPQLIPGHISHGCIRLRVTDDAWLAHHVTLGTPVHIM